MSFQLSRKSILIGFFVFLCLFSVTFFKFEKVFAITQEEQEAIWRDELAQTEQDILKWQSILNSTKANTKSLQQDAAILNAKIKQAQALIKQRNINIQQLGVDINKKTVKINQLEAKIEKGHESLSQLLRKTNQIDQFSLMEVVLGNKNISDFFSDIDSFRMIKKSLQDLFNQIRDTKAVTEKEKASLDTAKIKEIDTKMAVEAQKKQVEINEKQKQYLITVNKTQEKTYEQVLAEKQKRANEIKAALFKLRDTGAISFGEALQYAQQAAEKTGTRTAFLLAILTQESNLGQNVGSCLLTDITSGDGVGKNSGTIFEKVMKAPRDTVPFQTITARLGKDWKTTPISCPLGATYSSSRGYGGGMGPSQFIPSTWELFKDKVGSMIGISGDNANPWNARDAFMATAIYMKELGAVSGSYTAERNAACKYYSGSVCSSNRQPPNISYGNSVMSIAERIQTTMIDPLNF
ncbi:lytic murein transglycosylase [Patescibacteria group bacterium]|nr:lytic murein transglycosylase [Patescibacteria group bacterium]